MKSKKFLSLLFIVLFVFSASVAVSAAGANKLVCTVESSDSIVYSGSTITVDLVITENTGFVHSWIDIHYPADVLTVVKTADNKVISTDGTAYNPSKLSANDNPAANADIDGDRKGDGYGMIRVAIGGLGQVMDPANAELFNQTGKVASVTFKVKEGYGGTTSAPIMITTDKTDDMNTYSATAAMDFNVVGGTLNLTCIDEAAHVHNMSDYVQTKAPTCTEKGEAVSTCLNNCGKTETKDIAALNHDMSDWTQTVAPKCEIKGEETRTCKRADCGHTEKRDVAATGHNMSAYVQTKAPTCTEKGVSTSTCQNNCGKTETKDIAALGHDMGAWTQTVAPKCETKGEETRTCKRADCGHTEKRDVVATGHNMSAYVQTKAPTCTEKGVETSTCQNNCGKTETKDIAALGHNMSAYVQTKAPTCTDNGVATSTCQNNCGKTETKDIAALGHDWNKTAGTAATCSAEGKKDLWVCKTCKVTDTDNNGAVIAKLPHTPGVIAGKEATCTATGLTEGKKCLVCSEVLLAQEVIPVKAHNLSKEYVNDDASGHWLECVDCDYTEGKAAHTFKDGVCSVCGYGCDHKGGKATCSEKATCELCGKKYGSTLAHTPGAKATCNADQICTVCKAVIAKATGHSYVDHAAKAATCTEKGNKAYQTCKNCDYTSYEEIAATGHTLEDHAAQAATCGEIGWDAYKTCKNCDYTTYKEIAATGKHTYDNNCDASCNVCGETRTPADHVYDNACDADCNVCAAARTPADHTYGEWETVKEATTEEEGEKKHTCTECGSSETEVIEKLEPQGLAWWLILLIILGVLLIIIIIILIVRKKKKEEE